MHRLWHIFVLISTLLGVAAGGLLVIVPLALSGEPRGYRALMPWLKAAVGLAVVLLILEWVGIH